MKRLLYAGPCPQARRREQRTGTGSSAAENTPNAGAPPTWSKTSRQASWRRCPGRTQFIKQREEGEQCFWLREQHVRRLWGKPEAVSWGQFRGWIAWHRTKVRTSLCGHAEQFGQHPGFGEAGRGFAWERDMHPGLWAEAERSLGRLRRRSGQRGGSSFGPDGDGMDRSVGCSGHSRGTCW